MRIAICDDSKSDADLLLNKCKNMIVLQNADFSVFENGTLLLDSIKNNHFDIVLLDVEMPHINGINLGKKIKELAPSTIIIYISSFPKYAIDSYECDAFYYLLKPPITENLKSVIEKAVNLLKRKNEKIIVYQRAIPINISLSDVFYIECIKKHIIFHFENENNSVEIVGKLSETYELCKNYGFYQIHQGYIVNMSKISKIQGKNVHLKNGKTVEISVRKKTETILAYANFLEANI